ncbi:MAG: ABC transporter permease [Caldilinea sp.]|nr:ABC transporter permease [Caldilinea sp.]MDW8438910.1 ABC transporter permease [Caldilineaceae bacterium]
MTTTAQRVSSGAQPQIRKRFRLNRWDSPWLNPKFLIGLSMVLFVMLLGPIGQLFWDTRLALPASSPLNLPPPWAPGYTSETDKPVVQQVETVRPRATATPAVESAATAPAVSRSITGGNPFARTPAAEQAQPAATPARGSLTGGNPFATPRATESAAAPAAEQAQQPRQAVGAAAYARFGTPTWAHPLGTESSGRDMLAVLLVGAPRSLRIGLIAASIGMAIGVLLGFTAGYLGGWVDSVIRTISDAVIVIPALAVLIVIGAYVRVLQIENMALLLALFAWPGPTRLIRAQVLSMRERGYVQMARISGASSFHIMFLEMMPNMLPYIAASFTGNVSAAILAATGLEVLGLGPTRIPTLGMTIYYAISAAAILRGMWWWWGVPIVALVIVFSGLFLMTVGLDEIANPRLRGRKVTA